MNGLNSPSNSNSHSKTAIWNSSSGTTSCDPQHIHMIKQICNDLHQRNLTQQTWKMSTSFKRAYKACEACRKNKAKCELDTGAVVCSRCQREQRDCVFPAFRSTKRARRSGGTPARRNTPLRRGPSLPAHLDDQHAEDVELRDDSGKLSSLHVPSNSIGHERSSQPSSIPNTSNRESVGHGGTVTARQDASSEPTELESLRQRDDASSSEQEILDSANLQDDVLQTFVTNSSQAIGLLFKAAEHNDSESSDEQTAPNGPRHDDQHGSVYSMPSPALASNETLHLWSQHRFVRQGWFTEREAISYVEFFFTLLSPLSPVADAYYADHKNHKRLILEEPLLCCTILMIASRHHVPSKSSGGKARADFVHNRVWRHIEHLIQRITFGSEKYSLAKTRTFGSIQALLLIIEWHPRALHFPPENDGWDASLAPSIDDTFQQNTNSDGSKRWREDVFEPAKRSDRLSWMLVGLATTLAHELGVFDYTETDSNEFTFTLRKQTVCRIRRLLYIYVSQLSLRLGCTSIFPQSSHQNIALLEGSSEITEEQASQDRDLLTTKWIDITKLLVTANEMLFSSPATTKQMFRSFRYVSLLEHFQPLLQRWFSDFEKMKCKSIQAAAKDILLVEFHFVRMYINSIAIQALVERAKSYNSSNVWLDHDFLSPEFSHDFQFVKQVRESSLEILRVATQLSSDGVLQFCPVRVFLRIVAASIYLLKAISLGSREAEVARSLTQLQKCIEALQKDQADDIHLSNRYATLIARHVRHYKRNFRVKRATMKPRTTPRAVSRAQETGALRQPDERSSQPTSAHNITNISSDLGDEMNNPLEVSIDQLGSTTLDETGLMEDWLAQPFDLQCAPFGFDGLPPTSGLALDSLDFLWNMAT